MPHLNHTLSKTFVSGATAVTLLAGLGMARAPQAEAAQLTCTASAPCVLSDFLGTNNFFETGDKRFGNFFYTPTENAPMADEIKVFGEQVFTTDSNTISIVFESLSGGALFEAAPGERAEATLFHTVDIIEPNMFFDELHLSFEAEGPFAGITETVFDSTNPFPVPVAQLDVDTDNLSDSLLDTEGVSDLMLSSIRAEKDIELAGLDGNTARIFSFRQAYKGPGGRDIPEPASVLGLLTISGLGLGLKRKLSR